MSEPSEMSLFYCSLNWLGMCFGSKYLLVHSQPYLSDFQGMCSYLLILTFRPRSWEVHLRWFLIHITVVFGVLISSITRLAIRHIFSAFFRIWAWVHAKTVYYEIRLPAQSRSSRYFTRPEEIRHCMPPRDLLLAILRITPHSNRS